MHAPENRIPGEDSSQPLRPEDRRRWPRVADKNHSRIWFSTAMRGAQYGQLMDISLGGASISVQETTYLEPGKRVVVGIGEWMIPATVKHVVGNPRASYRVGLEWVRVGSAAATELVEQYRQTAELPVALAVEGTPEYEEILSAQS